MSFHLTECAAQIKLKPSLKLALMCFADSGSNEGRIAMPGIDGVMTWVGVERSQAMLLIRQLQELELLACRLHGYRGRRSEYIVFPQGCCERHGKVLTELHSVPEKGSDTSDPFLASAISTGSGTSDPVESTGSDRHQRKGPISPAERVRSPRSIATPPKDLLQQHSPGSDLTGPPASRETWPSLDFTRVFAVDPPKPEPSARGSCRHCHTGDICDDDGLPTGVKCPHCQPQIRGATA